MRQKVIALVIAIVITLAGAGAVVGNLYLQPNHAPSSNTTSATVTPVPLTFKNSISSVISDFSQVSFVMNYTTGPGGLLNITNMHVSYTVSTLPTEQVVNVTYSSPSSSGQFNLYMQNGLFTNMAKFNATQTGMVALKFWFGAARGDLNGASGFNSTTLTATTTVTKSISSTQMAVTTYTGSASNKVVDFPSVVYALGSPIADRTITVPVGVFAEGTASGISASIAFEVTSIVYSPAV